MRSTDRNASSWKKARPPCTVPSATLYDTPTAFSSLSLRFVLEKIKGKPADDRAGDTVCLLLKIEFFVSSTNLSPIANAKKELLAFSLLHFQRYLLLQQRELLKRNAVQNTSCFDFVSRVKDMKPSFYYCTSYSSS